MAIAKMKKLTLAVTSHDADTLMQKLMWSGAVEVSDGETAFGRDERLRRRDDIDTRLEMLSKELAKYENALNILKKQEKAPGGLFPKKKVFGREKYDSPEKTFEEANAICTSLYKVLDAVSELSKKEENLRALNTSLAPWQSFKSELSKNSTATCEMILGSLPLDIDLSAFESELDNTFDGRVYLEKVSESETSQHICLIGLKSEESEILALASKYAFIKTDLSGLKLTAKKESEKLTQDIEITEIERTNQQTKLIKLALSADTLRLACDIVSSQIAKCEAEKKLICTKSTVILSGWVPEKKVDEIEKILSGYLCASFYEDPKEEDDVPTLLVNNSVTKPFESIIDMYVLPRYGSFDPTAIMSFFYFIIFGLMLADVVYGLMLTVVGFWAIKKLDLGEGIKQLVKLFAICGISCTVAGVFFGSYLGDLPSAVYTAFGGEAFVMPLTLIDTLGDPITLIVVSLVVGFIHMIAGLAIKFYTVCRDVSFFAAFFDVGGWFIVFTGAGLIFLVKGLLGPIVLGVGLAVMMTGGALSKKGVFGRAIGAFGSIYGFVGFASDLISYSRIMALGLTSAIIASVFNILATIALPSPIGFVLFVIVIAVGHILNLGINIIGTFVHASRLQYIEFFGKFYEDGGRKFLPLKSAEKYTKIADPNTEVKTEQVKETKKTKAKSK